MLVWESTEDDVGTRRGSGYEARGAHFLIDGQQRLQTLARCEAGDIDVVFNLDTEEFKRANATTRRGDVWVAVSDVWSRRYTDLLRGINRQQRQQRLERLREMLRYEVAVVHMQHHSFENAVEAFTRINTLGVKLRTQDIELSLIHI